MVIIQELINQFQILDVSCHIEQLNGINSNEFKFQTKKFGSATGISCPLYSGVSFNRLVGPYNVLWDEDNFGWNRFKEIVNFFKETNDRMIVQTTSTLEDRSIANTLIDYKFMLSYFSSIYFKRIDNFESGQPLKNEVVELIDPNPLIAVFNKAFETKGIEEDSISLGELMTKNTLGSEKFKFFGIEEKNKLVSVAGIYTDKGNSFLCGAGTLENHRNKGYQSDLIRYRANLAKELGSKYLVTNTAQSASSQRNMERAGFNLAYSKISWFKSFDEL